MTPKGYIKEWMAEYMMQEKTVHIGAPIRLLAHWPANNHLRMRERTWVS